MGNTPSGLFPPELNRALTDSAANYGKKRPFSEGSPSRRPGEKSKQVPTNKGEQKKKSENRRKRRKRKNSDRRRKRRRRKQKKTRKARGIIDDLRELCTTGRCGRPR